MIYVSFDDFCQEYMNDNLFNALHSLKKQYPNFRVTMFTIPNRCSIEWLKKIRKEYPYIQMAVHGTSHINVDEYKDIEYAPLQYFVKGYKAPWWKLDKEGYNWLRDKGYWVAVDKSAKYWRSNHKLAYRYDKGKMLRYASLYYNRGDYFWHGHIGNNCVNGLDETFYILLKKWTPKSNFGFIDNFVRKNDKKQESACN